MPKKKTAIADEGTQIAQIVDQVASQELGVPVKDGNIVEPKKEEVVETVPKEPDEVIADFDPDKFAEQTAEKAAQKLREYELKEKEEKEAQVTKAEQEAKLKDELIPAYVREGRNPKDYAEINDEAQRIAEIKFNRLLEQREQERLAKSEEQAKAREAELAKSKKFEEDFNKMIDEEVDELYQNNKLPKIINKDDANDVGVKAKYELFKTMADVNTKRVKEGLQPITSISRIYNNYYKPSDSQPAGVDAPISVGRGTVTPTDTEEVMPYHKLHKASFLDLFRVKK